MLGGKKAENDEAAAKKKFSRRDFLVTGGVAIAADAILVATPAKAAAVAVDGPIPKSQGYIVYDNSKCIGCTTCMLSCSLVHYGQQNLSLARIQIIQDSFGKFPHDLTLAPCRQCVEPVCVRSCPVGAAHVDTANGNVRVIDEKKCVGCKTCINMCPQQPHRTVWNHETKKSSKCDLCIDTPHWNEKGGPGGKQACITNCPMNAIKFVAEAPNQKETDGYQVNLRNEHWMRLGLVDDSRTVRPAAAKTRMTGISGAPKPKSSAKPGAKPQSKPKE